MTRKVLDLRAYGQRFICVEHMGDMNPYRLYEMTWDSGWHRQQIAKYANIESVLYRLLELM